MRASNAPSPAGVEPSLVRFQSDGRQLVVASRAERNLSIFETAGGRVVVRLPLPIEPRNLCVKPDGGEMFVTGDGMDAVVIVYPYSTEIAETMLAGRAPGAMAVTDSAATSFLLVANPQTNSVTVLDYDNTGRKLVAAVNVGQEPGAIVITPDQQYALVLNQKSGDLAVIRMYALTNQDASRTLQTGAAVHHDSRGGTAGERSGRRVSLKRSYFFLPCAATASIAAFTFSGSPR